MKNKIEYSADEIKSRIEDAEKEKLFNIGKSEIGDMSTYNFSYPKIIEYFKQLKKDEDIEQWLVCGSSIVYSWMPTILNFHTKTDNYEDDDIFEAAKKALVSIGKIMDPKNKFFDSEIIKNTLSPLKDFINNSIVGVSKFLHFSYPRTFPIWDSRVERAFSKVKNNSHRTNNIDNYVKYCISIHEIIEGEKEKWMNNGIFEKDLFKDKKPIRKIEYALFIIGKKKDQE